MNLREEQLEQLFESLLPEVAAYNTCLMLLHLITDDSEQLAQGFLHSLDTVVIPLLKAKNFDVEAVVYLMDILRQKQQGVFLRNRPHPFLSLLNLELCCE